MLIARIKRYRDAFNCTLPYAKDACEYDRDLNSDKTEFLKPAAQVVLTDSGRDEALVAVLALAEHLVRERESVQGEGRTLEEMEEDDELPGAIKMARAAILAAQSAQGSEVKS